jgi:hypothetical protein
MTDKWSRDLRSKSLESCRWEVTFFICLMAMLPSAWEKSFFLSSSKGDFLYIMIRIGL